MISRIRSSGRRPSVVSTAIESGRHRSRSSARSRSGRRCPGDHVLRHHRAAYAAERSTLDGSLPLKRRRLPRHPAVGVHDDLAAGEAESPLRPPPRTSRWGSRGSPGPPRGDRGGMTWCATSSIRSSRQALVRHLVVVLRGEHTVRTGFGTPRSYSTVTCVLPSGRRYGRMPRLRTSASRRRAGGEQIGQRHQLGVSRQRSRTSSPGRRAKLVAVARGAGLGCLVTPRLMRATARADPTRSVPARPVVEAVARVGVPDLAIVSRTMS